MLDGNLAHSKGTECATALLGGGPDCTGGVYQHVRGFGVPPRDRQY